MITLWVLACILYFSLHIENAMTPFLKVQNDIQTNEYEPTAHATFTYSRSQCGFWHGRPLSPTSSSTLSLGITGTALKWVELYLSNQLQHIFSGGCLVDNIKLAHGVSQHSNLGPPLFIICSRKLFEVINDHLPVAHAQADNTQPYLSLKPSITSSQSEAIQARELYTKAIRAWMITDKLKLNYDKNKFWIIGTQPQLSKFHFEKVSISDVSIAPAVAQRTFGIWVDTNLA